MFNSLRIKFFSVTSALFSILITLVLSFSNMTPANAFVGTLENGNMAYAQGSGFDKGEACNYLPGITPDIYDAWHFVLTTRGAVFQQDPANPAIAINLNFVFMRQDGSTFVIKSGAWVQTGKGAYTYTLKADKIRMVQIGSVAKINVIDSGMRLSHTCPGTGSATTPSTPTSSPTPTASPSTSISSSPTPTPTASRSSSPTPTATTSTSSSPTATRSSSPSPSITSTPTPTASRTPSASPSNTRSATPSARPSVRASAIQPHSTRSPNPSGSPFPRNPIPTPSTSIQPIGSNSPTPSVSPSPSSSRSSSPSPTNNPTPSNSPSASPEPTNPNTPPVIPTPPPVDDPQNVQYIPPTTPTTITPTEPPASPIVITTPPQYGKVTVNNDSITYTPNPVNPNKPVVDLVVFQYTNLSGATVVVRKEFIVTQSGDVPKIIQTGFGDTHTKAPVSLLIITLFIALTTFGLRGKKNNA